MKTKATKIDFTMTEARRIYRAAKVYTQGTKVSFRAFCKRLILDSLERIEAADGE